MRRPLSRHRVIDAATELPEYEVIVINDGLLGRHAGRAEVRVRAVRSRGVLGASRSAPTVNSVSRLRTCYAGSRRQVPTR